jgi:hypothetical protein
MSIRTLSDSIALRPATPRIERAGRIVSVLLLAAVILTGCSSGNARDTAREKAKDAGLPEVLAAEQATHTAEKYFPSTSTPAPTEPPAPAMSELVITFGFRSDGTPDGSYASVPAGAGTAYAAAHVVDLSAGLVIRAVVTDGWGNEIARPEVTITPGAVDRWIALPIGLPADLAPGEYGVFVLSGDRTLGSLAFGVTGAGSSAQLLPDAPVNPQVRSTLPPPGMAPAQAQPTATFAPNSGQG